MSRPRLTGLPGGPQIGGGVLLGDKPPEPVSLLVQGEDGKRQIFPVVASHVFTDNAISVLAQIIGNVVEQVLARHGLITLPEPPPAPASPVDPGTAKA